MVFMLGVGLEGKASAGRVWVAGPALYTRREADRCTRGIYGCRERAEALEPRHRRFAFSVDQRLIMTALPECGVMPTRVEASDTRKKRRKITGNLKGASIVLIERVADEGSVLRWCCAMVRCASLAPAP
jgi:hypothetical protein